MPVILEDYQNRVVNALMDVYRNAVQGVPNAPNAAVLHAPTASGKTVMLARALSGLSDGGAPVAWFWFAPFDNIIVQTEKAIRSEAGESLRPKHLRDRVWQGHRSGDVWVSTAALASSSKAGPAEDTEFSPSLRSMAEKMRTSGLRIGVVIDEAHLNAKQKGKFIEAIGLITPDVVFAATATPNDEALDKFFAGLGIESSATITVDRDEAVRRHLNKKGLWARIVSTPGAGKDAKIEMLVRATWNRNLEVNDALTEAGLDIVPLALFQADNKAEGEKMLDAVRRVTGLSKKAIAFYDSESKSKSQRTLNDIADDPDVKALVFKVAAGTGFDAPRAFCLGSARTVRDETSAAQFVGRTMRVPRPLRAFLFKNPDHPLVEILNNAHVFLLDEEAQTGFAAVVHKIAGSFAAAGMSDVSIRRTDDHGRDLIEDVPAVSALRAEILRRAGPDGEGYDTFDDLEYALGEDMIDLQFPRDDAFRKPLQREEWRQHDEMSDVDVLSKLRGAVVTPQRVKDRISRADGLFDVVETGDDLTTEEDEDQIRVQRWKAERAAKADATHAFHASVSLIPGLAEPGKARKLLVQMTEEILDTGIVGADAFGLASRVAVLIATEFHGEMKTAATKGDGAGRVMRTAAPLPDAYLTHGGVFKNPKMAYKYWVRDTNYVRPPDDVARFMADLSERGMRIGGVLKKIAVSDATTLLNKLEADFLTWTKSQPEIASVFRNPHGKPYSCCYANISGQTQLFYPDFIVAMRDGRQIAVETKYDRKDLREKIAGRNEAAEALPVVFVVLNPITNLLEEVTGYDEQGREMSKQIAL